MDIERMIWELGVRVEEAELPYGWWGRYDARQHLIQMRPSLSPLQFTSTMVHECGHAFYRHEGTMPRQEKQANHWACRRLINQSEFVDALQQTDDKVAIAHLIQVLPRDVQNYVDSLTKIERLLLTQMLNAEPISLKEAG